MHHWVQDVETGKEEFGGAPAEPAAKFINKRI